jgi:hypothetical protein
LIEGEKLPNPDEEDIPSDDTVQKDDENVVDDPSADDNSEKDHSKCESSGWKRFWNAIANFFRMIFGASKKCVCGDKF